MDSQSDEIKISWPKAKEIMLRLGQYDKLRDPISQFDWTQIGLKRVELSLAHGWFFNIINKEKLIHSMIKYNFTL